MEIKKVLITGGNGDIAKAIAKNLRQRGSYDIRLPGKQTLDVTNIDMVSCYVDAFTPDILINNAGFVEPQSIRDCNIQLDKRSLDINLFGTFNVTAAVLQRNSQACIINIGSSAATKVHGTWSAYCAAKAGVVMATKCWAEDGVHAVCISPGRTATKMRAGLYPSEDKNTLLKPEDFAKIVCYAVEGRYENGVHINVTLQNIEELLDESDR